MRVEFHRRAADAISAADLHDVLALRGEVFVVEQGCAYADIDGRDLEPGACHLWFRDDVGVAAALRILAEPCGGTRVGRVVTRRDVRGSGLASRLVVSAVGSATAPVVIHAQAHLASWYARFGFDAGIDPRRWVEDGIPHVAMTRSPGPRATVVESVPVDDPDLIELLDELVADLRRRYPSMVEVDAPAAIVELGGGFVLAGLDGVPVACGAVRRLPDGRAELKRMYVRPEMRGRGLVRLLLETLESHAAAQGHDALYLVTGDRQPEAIAAYRREGFVDTAPWGEWVDIPPAICMVRPIGR